MGTVVLLSSPPKLVCFLAPKKAGMFSLDGDSDGLETDSGPNSQMAAFHHPYPTTDFMREKPEEDVM